MKTFLVSTCLVLNFLNLEAQTCLDNLQPGVSLPPANTKDYWNWKGDDASKFDGTGNYFFRQAFGQSIGIVNHYGPFTNTLSQPNTFQFTNYPIDYEESDGWELAYRYFGEIIPCQNDKTNAPYFAIYNRHSGILRIFVTLTSMPGFVAHESIHWLSLSPHLTAI